MVKLPGHFPSITELSYGTTAREYLRDLAAAEACNDSTCDRFLWSGHDNEFD